MSSGKDSGIFNVIVGTAGHIDHGKSALVERLTGIHPDRLKEEQERGMTIDLGFAPYRTKQGKSVGIIDVPGHERFVKNMVAGATSVDVAMLVVAADDGVMPQTREHLEIMGLLGITRGLVVVTKRDLVQPDYLELALDDIGNLLRGTFLERAPLIAVSNVTGEGIEELRDELERLIESTPRRDTEGLFRMPIQRVFSAKGHGTVLTGVPLSGKVAIGDAVEVLPLGLGGRVRAIQAYKQDRSEARAGHSTALNLAEIDFHQVNRGDTVAAPGFFRGATLFEARLAYLRTRSKPLRPRTEVRFHSGTSEVLGTMTLLDREQLLPGEEGLVQIAVEQPIVAVAGDRFLVRQPSPMETLGGGVVLGESRHRLKRLKAHVIDLMKAKEDSLADQDQRLLVTLKESHHQPLNVQALAFACKQRREDVEVRLAELVKRGGVVAVQKTGYLLAEAFAGATAKLVQTVESYHAGHPLRKWMELRDLRTETQLPEATLLEAVEAAVAQGALIAEKGGRLRSASFRPQLSAKQEAGLELLRAAYATADVNPPSTAEVAAKIGEPEAAVESLVRLLAEEGELVKAGEYHFHHTAIARAAKLLQDDSRKRGGEVNIPALRDQLGTSRKYIIPLLEHFDTIGLTVRRGDKRLLRSKQE